MYHASNPKRSPGPGESDPYVGPELSLYKKRVSTGIPGQGLNKRHACKCIQTRMGYISPSPLQLNRPVERPRVFPSCILKSFTERHCGVLCEYIEYICFAKADGIDNSWSSRPFLYHKRFRERKPSPRLVPWYVLLTSGSGSWIHG